MIELTDDKIDTDAVLASVIDHAAGASVLFVGTTREFTGRRQTTSLEYECYPEMAKKKLQELLDEAHQNWPIVKSTIIHRLGHLGLGEASIAVAVSTAHRRDAFESAQWIMDRLKQIVPIWKKENWADGTTEWVHPGVPAPSKPAPSKPVPPKPAPSKPAPSKPAPSKPAPSKPAPSNQDSATPRSPTPGKSTANKST